MVQATSLGQKESVIFTSVFCSQVPKILCYANLSLLYESKSLYFRLRQKLFSILSGRYQQQRPGKYSLSGPTDWESNLTSSVPRLARLFHFIYNLAQSGFDSAQTSSQFVCSLCARTKKALKGLFFVLVRPEGIEPSTNPWQGLIIPLNHGRKLYFAKSFSASSIQRFNLCFKTVLAIIVFPEPLCNVSLVFLVFMY